MKPFDLYIWDAYEKNPARLPRLYGVIPCL